MKVRCGSGVKLRFCKGLLPFHLQDRERIPFAIPFVPFEGVEAHAFIELFGAFVLLIHIYVADVPTVEGEAYQPFA